MSTALEQAVSQATSQFQARFGRAPQWISAAPGRVNIIGEHVDYNDGFVLPMAIERYCVLAAGECAAPDGVGTFYSTATNEEASVSLVAPERKPKGAWSNYVAGVVHGCLKHGMALTPFQAVIHSTVPYGGGLSSSASLEMATATLFEAMTGVQLSPREKVQVGLLAEHEFAGVPCGNMDQSASAMCRPEHLMLLDCRSQEVEQIPLDDPNISVLIINTNVKHELTGGEYAQRRRQCESAAAKLGVTSLRDATLQQLQARESDLTPVEYRRARHVVGEIARTLDAVAAIKERDWPVVGRLMYGSHDSLRDDYEVSCAELDLLVDLAREVGANGGVYGSRMTGGGFGGCTVSIVATARAQELAERLAAKYEASTGIAPTALTSRPARGAHIVKA